MSEAPEDLYHRLDQLRLRGSVDRRQSFFRHDSYDPAVLGIQHWAGKHTQRIDTVSRFVRPSKQTPINC